MKQQYKLYILFLATLFIFLIGCTEENQTNSIGKDTNGLIRITVKIPTTSLPKSSLKSGQTATESQVNEIQILIFENGKYAYKVAGEGITQSENTAVFHARLRSSDAPTILYIVANNNAIINVNEPVIGTPIEQVKTLFNTFFSESGVGGNAALWGSYTLASGINNSLSNELNNIQLLRAVARVDIEVASTASNFTLETVQVFRASNRIQIIPNNPNSIPMVTEPSIPINNLYDVNTNVVSSTSAVLSEAQIYLPESKAPELINQTSQATCVVVGGKYNNAAVSTYYRLDFNPQIQGHPLGQILRNHRYIFSISEVNSNGFNTAAQAANNPSSGMNTSLQVWPDDNIHYMFFDNNNYFGVSETTVVLPGAINSTDLVAASTDVSSYFLLWDDSQTIPEPPSSSLNDGIFSITQTNGGETLEFTALTENPIGGVVRERRIRVQAGNLQQIFLTIRQAPLRGTEWAKTNVDMPETFAPTLNSMGMFYQWNRNIPWPTEGIVAGWDITEATGQSWESANDPCPNGWRLPTSDELRLLANSPGQRWYLGTEPEHPNQGAWFAPSVAEANAATFDSPGSAIFLPTAGGRDNNGMIYNGNSNGYYWSSDLDIANNPNILSIASGTSFVYASTYRRYGFLIRCVRE